MFMGWKVAVLGRQSMERKLLGMTAACDAARHGALRDKEALAESRNQSSELQEEMRSDVEAISRSMDETKEQVAILKARLSSTKEAASASKVRSLGEKDAVVVELKELRVERAELNDALGQSHVEEARLGALVGELQGQIAALTIEKEQDLVSGARERRDRDAVIGALELQNSSKTTELDEAKA